MTEIRLATGLALHESTILLVASRYASHPQPLWNLPGGRIRPGELLQDAVRREVLEETALSARVGDLAYVSESFDGDTHVVNATFEIEVTGTPRIPESGDHVVAAQWVPLGELAQHLRVNVVREPLERYLGFRIRYTGFAQAGITIRWPDE
jgi:8-oxo-dGTP diphosphatase